LYNLATYHTQILERESEFEQIGGQIGGGGRGPHISSRFSVAFSLMNRNELTCQPAVQTRLTAYK